MVNLEDQPPTNGDPKPVEMEAPINSAASKGAVMVNPEAVNNVMYSEIGINVLLNRLKQSIASVRDFSSFLAKRARLEDEHAKGLEKLSRSTQDSIRRPDGRQGSYAQQLADVCRAHDRMAEHGSLFANSLHQMHLDLDKLATTMEFGRKQWKQEGTANEKKVKDAEIALEKAKAKYDSLADDYDKARTGGGNSGRVFTVKGPKSAERHEEDLHKKLQSADTDYSSKVQMAQVARQDNLKTARPQAVKAIQELIRECDSALTLQLQKFAAFNERLLVGNGLEVSPVKGGGGEASKALSMREMIHKIDNDRDFHNFVSSHSGSVPATPAEIKYEKHSTLGPTQQVPQISTPTANTRQSFQQSPQAAQAPKFPVSQQAVSLPASTSFSPSQTQQPSAPIYPSNQSQQPPSISKNASPQTPYQTSSPPPNAGYSQSRQPSQDVSFRNSSQQSQQQPHPSTTSGPAIVSGPYGTNGSYSERPAQQQHGYAPNALQANGNYGPSPNSTRLPPVKPVFGQSLEALFKRDDTAVPMVVYQCIQAVELFGLEVEGIYRLSGNANHINQLKAVFDNDSARVDFRNPEAFFHDINSVAGLLKQFFRELPDPLFTAEHYNEFIEAAKIDDDNVRRDSIHAVINGLPDPNYATLRALVLHLHRVGERSQSNRMSTHNLAICFAPTLMGQHSGPQMADAGLQARVVDMILRNTYQIFDED